MPYSSRDKAYVPGAKPKADMSALDKELQELVAELQPTPEERQRQLVWPFTCLHYSQLQPWEWQAPWGFSAACKYL